jgi:hypothetical protein
MGKAWLQHETLVQHVLSLQDQLFSLPSNLVDAIEHEIYHQWKMLMTDLKLCKSFSQFTFIS